MNRSAGSGEDTAPQTLPEFSLPATGGQTFDAADYRGARRGKFLILYFYPKDNTPGCTTEAEQFRDHHDQLQQLRCTVFGISRDSLKSHENFKAKLVLPFDLLSDTEEIACQLFGVIKMKNLYGKQVRGIERSTFLFDGRGQLIQAWRGVKVPNHVTQVLECLASQ